MIALLTKIIQTVVIVLLKIMFKYHVACGLLTDEIN